MSSTKIRCRENFNYGTKSSFTSGSSWAHNAPSASAIIEVGITPLGDKFWNYYLVITDTTITLYHNAIGGVDFKWTVKYVE